MKTALYNRISALRPSLAAAAQSVYDAWDPSDEDDDFGGGICDSIASRFGDLLSSIPGVEIADGSQEGDDHAYVVVLSDSEAFAVDISPYVYETGGGYSWKKRPGVVFSASHVSIDKLDRSLFDDRYEGSGAAMANIPLKTLDKPDVNAPSSGVVYTPSKGTHSMLISGDRQLGVRMHQWHHSMSDPLYAVGSQFYAGRQVERESLQNAIDSLDRAVAGSKADERQKQALMKDLKKLLASSPKESYRRPSKGDVQLSDSDRISGSPALAGRMHEWHASMSDPLYIVGSSFKAGNKVSRKDLRAAISSLEKSKGDTPHDESTRKSLLRDLKRLSVNPSGGACCDGCADGKECCGDDHDHAPSGSVSDRSDGEAAASRDAHGVLADLRRKYGFNDPNDVGVRVAVRNGLGEHARRLAAKRSGNSADFVDGFMSRAESMVFRQSSAIQRRSSGSIDRGTGVAVIGAGVAVLAGAGAAHWWLKKSGR